jgi:hypothetical protein
MKIHHKGELGHLMSCKNVYITSTASEFFPHNSRMPQISFTYSLLMAAHDMIDALKHPHLDVPFSTIEDDTITALTTLATIFKNKYKKPSVPVFIDSQVKAAENKQTHVVLIQHVITSPVKHNSQKRSHTEAYQSPDHVSESQKSPKLPRVVTSAVTSAAPPRVPARVRKLSPRNVSQGDFFDIGSFNNSIAL